MGLLLGHNAWQRDRPSNGSMWNSYSFQPIGPWMGYSFTDLGAEGCCRSLNALLYPHTTKLLGGILVSLRPSVRPSVPHPVSALYHLQFRMDSFRIMINSMRGCVTCDDPWPWPISSRSFGLDLENRVRSVASTVLDGFFLYFAQMISIIRGSPVCRVLRFFQNLEI